MNLKHKYYFWENELSPKMCEDIIKLGLSKKNKKGTIFDTNISNSKLKKLRDSSVVFLDETWLFKLVNHYIKKANELSGWNFDIDYIENMQFTIYKENQHYGWHCDSTEEPYHTPDDIKKHGKMRKISATISLTDPKKYKGGDFEFDFRCHNNIKKNKFHKVKEIKKRGGIVVFPSHLWHRVLPITKGTRYSLVVWTCGRPFK